MQRAEEELGARRRDESLEVLFQQAKRIEAPAFVAGEGIGNDRVMNLFKEGTPGDHLASRCLRLYCPLRTESRNRGERYPGGKIHGETGPQFLLKRLKSTLLETNVPRC